jgi:hypothetical protein
VALGAPAPAPPGFVRLDRIGLAHRFRGIGALGEANANSWQVVDGRAGLPIGCWSGSHDVLEWVRDAGARYGVWAGVGCLGLPRASLCSSAYAAG